jgi:hypothetical protein
MTGEHTSVERELGKLNATVKAMADTLREFKSDTNDRLATGAEKMGQMDSKIDDLRLFKKTATWTGTGLFGFAAFFGWDHIKRLF